MLVVYLCPFNGHSLRISSISIGHSSGQAFNSKWNGIRYHSTRFQLSLFNPPLTCSYKWHQTCITICPFCACSKHFIHFLLWFQCLPDGCTTFPHVTTYPPCHCRSQQQNQTSFHITHNLSFVVMGEIHLSFTHKIYYNGYEFATESFGS